MKLSEEQKREIKKGKAKNIVREIIAAAESIACLSDIAYPKKRILQPKNRKPYGRMKRNLAKMQMSMQKAMTTARVHAIMSTPYPVYEPGASGGVVSYGVL